MYILKTLEQIRLKNTLIFGWEAEQPGSLWLLFLPYDMICHTGACQLDPVHILDWLDYLACLFQAIIEILVLNMGRIGSNKLWVGDDLNYSEYFTLLCQNKLGKNLNNLNWLKTQYLKKDYSWRSVWIVSQNFKESSKIYIWISPALGQWHGQGQGYVYHYQE